MIVPWYGVFLTHPIPLELSMGVCSHACEYCFVRLSRSKFDFNFASLVRQLQDVKSGKLNTLVKNLIAQGFPVCMSNRSDPFAESNWKTTIQVVKLLSQFNIPIHFMTKGGKGIDEVLGMIKPSCWYITCGISDPDLMRRIEPGAPSLKERFALIEKLVANGHSVNVGFNPCVPEWLKEYKWLVGELKKSGVFGIYIDLLHFDKWQKQRISKEGREAMGEANIEEMSNFRSEHTEHKKFAEEVREYILSQGMTCEIPGFSEASHYFDKFEEVYGKDRVFPTLQNLATWCFERENEMAQLSFSKCLEAMKGSYPIFKNKVDMNNYIASVCERLACKYKGFKTNSYKSFISWVWEQMQYPYSPVNMDCFSFVKENGEWVCDENDVPYLVFSRKGHKDYFVEVI